MPMSVLNRDTQSPLDQPIAITFFKTFAATEKREQQYSLRALAGRIKAVTASSKSQLPWLKLAKFGDTPTDKDSLRHDANVLCITGIEADYDAGSLTVTEACIALENQGIAAMVYTSPSHTEDSPRWRILCPTSTELKPEQRQQLVGRLNGLFRGILAGESYTLSQSYYFGSVNHNPSHEVHLIDGTPIDQHDELDQIWIGRPHTTSSSAKPDRQGSVDLSGLMSDIITGASYHTAMVRIAGLFARQRVPYMQAHQRITDAMNEVPPEKRDGRWIARFEDIDRTLEDIYGKEAVKLDQAQSTIQEPPEYLSAPIPCDDYDPIGPDEAYEQYAAEPTPTPATHFLSTPEFLNTFTNPDYIVDGIIQRGRLISLTSPTGHGKTAVALYLGTMISIGRNIGGIEVEQGEVLFLAGENPDDLCGRFHAAVQYYQIKPENMNIGILPGNFPLTPDDAEKIKQEINAREKPTSVILIDSAAAYFSGDDENHNVQAGAYARNLRVLTTCRGNPAVIVLCHPIKAASRDTLLPRGGGAFLAEVDANLTLWSDAQGENTTLHWQGKIRGADFSPVNFSLIPVKLENLRDQKGRPFMSVIATLQTTEEAEQIVQHAISDENTVLEWLRRHPGIAVRNIALNAGWVSEKGAPHVGKVQRALKSLSKDKLAKPFRRKWIITDTGKKVLRGENID